MKKELTQQPMARPYARLAHHHKDPMEMTARLPRIRIKKEEIELLKKKTPG